MLESSRREFLKFVGMGTIAATVPSFRLFSAEAGRARLGLQLYTVRKIIETDFEGTIRKLGEMGFAGIETYMMPKSITFDHAGKVFREAALKVIGMHAPLPVGQQREEVLRMADAYRCDRVIYPGGTQEVEKYRSAPLRKQAVESYDEVADFLHGRGLRFGLHNHWGEFEETDGILPFYFLLENLDDRIFFEVDTYWAKVAGSNPAKVVADFGKRAPLLHIKDGPAVKGESIDAQLPAGEGVMNFPGIVKAGGRNTEWMIAEFDGYGKDIFDGIARSYAYLIGNGLARGKG